MFKAYLTIDDGPSEKFEELVDFLADRDVPAVFFNRGDAMKKNPKAVIHGIQKGYIMANHGYSHRRASELSADEFEQELLKTEEILDDLYAQATIARPGKYFRFPYMDRGMGHFLVEPENVPDEYDGSINYLIERGLGHDLSENDAPPLLCGIQKKRDFQEILKQNGFTPLPTSQVTIPWYLNTEMSAGIDSLCTFSTSDWALTQRHKGKHGFEDLDDLKVQIDEDISLLHEESAHIILAHDQAEIFDVTTTLIEYFLENGFEFLDFLSEEG